MVMLLMLPCQPCQLYHPHHHHDVHHHDVHLTHHPCQEPQVQSEPSLPFHHLHHHHEVYFFHQEDQMPFLPNQQPHPFQQQDYPIHGRNHPLLLGVDQEEDILQPDQDIRILVEDNQVLEEDSQVLEEDNQVLEEDNLVGMIDHQQVGTLHPEVDIPDLEEDILQAWVGPLHLVEDVAQTVVDILA